MPCISHPPGAKLRRSSGYDGSVSVDITVEPPTGPPLPSGNTSHEQDSYFHSLNHSPIMLPQQMLPCGPVLPVAPRGMMCASQTTSLPAISYYAHHA
ncbi:hypothetical protein BDQ17DRAFT_1429373 [Cyathus striatus]|nr:hypothetical protein BDQ17DRAFT_1429373 [Cyathus striatus]